MENFLRDHVSVWDILKNTPLPIVLYGMGDGADKVLQVFEKLHISPAAVMASDTFVRGQSFHGYPVQKLSDIEKQFDSFLIALCFGSQRPEVIGQIKDLAKKHKVLVPSVPVFGETICNERFLCENAESLHKAYHLLEDNKSKDVFKNILTFEYTGELPYLFNSESSKNEVLQTLIQPDKQSFYVDAGACKGDTIEEFLKFAPEYKVILAFEPNAKNFEKLQLHCRNIPNTELWNLALYRENAMLYFNKKSGRCSARSLQGTPVQAADLDSLLQGRRPTYVKMDVEGMEAEALQGAKNTLQTYKPKLNIAAYHQTEDLFALPLLIHEIQPNYKIYLRHHPYIPFWDTNLYCV